MRSIGQQPTSLRITTCLGDLCEPDGRIDGKCLVRECLDGDAFAGWEEETPEIFDSHLYILFGVVFWQLGPDGQCDDIMRRSVREIERRCYLLQLFCREQQQQTERLR
mmetsp:Transcript_7729/g.12746  ORF Transcript_7729/g.12746 Transcript_7729/m.12746 type:complete len:108 (+) Transcript_7729:145-468(+)